MMVIAEQYSSLIDDKTTLQRKNSTSVDEEMAIRFRVRKNTGMCPAGNTLVE
jgi:hypothetical protein